MRRLRFAPRAALSACATCGVGAVPQPPLAADLSKMGKKAMDHAPYGGFLVITASLASVLRAQASGVSFQPVRQRSGIENRFCWIEAEQTLRPMEASNVVKRTLCPTCGRSGHYHPYKVPWEVHYSQASLDGAADVAAMYEHFGVWKVRASASAVHGSTSCRSTHDDSCPKAVFHGRRSSRSPRLTAAPKRLIRCSLCQDRPMLPDLQQIPLRRAGFTSANGRLGSRAAL